METIDEIVNLLRFIIIPLGTTFRVVFCFVKMIYDEDAANAYKKKIWNVIAFLIVSEFQIFPVYDIRINTFEISFLSYIRFRFRFIEFNVELRYIP